MSNHDPLREYLASLPDADAPERLWVRVGGAHRRRTRRRQWGVGGAAVLALAVAGVLPFQLSRQPASGPAPAFTAMTAVGEAPVDAADADARLRALDRELQAAYHRNANEAEIAELWTTRHALLASRRGRPVDPVRI